MLTYFIRGWKTNKNRSFELSRVQMLDADVTGRVFVFGGSWHGGRRREVTRPRDLFDRVN